MSDNDDKLVNEINEMFHTLHQKEAEYRAMFGPIPAPSSRVNEMDDPDDYFGKCPVCNDDLFVTDNGDKGVRDITQKHPHVYVHRCCYEWLNSLVRKGQCDSCQREDVELVGWNCHGKLCMICAGTYTILPLSEYKEKGTS